MASPQHKHSVGRDVLDRYQIDVNHMSKIAAYTSTLLLLHECSVLQLCCCGAAQRVERQLNVYLSLERGGGTTAVFMFLCFSIFCLPGHTRGEYEQLVRASRGTARLEVSEMGSMFCQLQSTATHTNNRGSVLADIIALEAMMHWPASYAYLPVFYLFVVYAGSELPLGRQPKTPPQHTLSSKIPHENKRKPRKTPTPTPTPTPRAKKAVLASKSMTPSPRRMQFHTCQAVAMSGMRVPLPPLTRLYCLARGRRRRRLGLSVCAIGCCLHVRLWGFGAPRPSSGTAFRR